MQNLPHQGVKTIPSSTTDFGKGEHNAPHLALVTETIFTDDLELGIPVVRVLEDVHRLEQRQARASVAETNIQTSGLESCNIWSVITFLEGYVR